MSSRKFTIIMSVCFAVLMLVKVLNWIEKRKAGDMPPPPPVAWYQTQIEVTYLKEGKDTFDLEVDESNQTILIDNGNISYWRTNKQRGGITSRITICSFARTFRILSSEKHIVNENN